MLEILKRFTFAEFANSCFLCFDFSPTGIRFFSDKKKLISKILLPALILEGIKAPLQGFAQNQYLRYYLLDFITTFSTCEYFVFC